MNLRPVGTLEIPRRKIQASLQDAAEKHSYPAMNCRANFNRPYRDEEAVKCFVSFAVA